MITIGFPTSGLGLLGELMLTAVFVVLETGGGCIPVQ